MGSGGSFPHSKNPDRLLYRGFAALSELKVKMVPGDVLLFYALQGAHGEAPHDHHGWWKCRKCRSNFLPTIGDKPFDGQESECRGGQDARKRPLLGACGDGQRMGSGGSFPHSKNPDRLLYRGFAALSELKVKMVPGDVLLSHGEAPHYHRR